MNEMKKILLFLCLIPFVLSAQTVNNVNPGRTVLVSNLAIAGIGGADSTFKFRMEGGCYAYSIEIIQTDTIETVPTGAFLYGGNTGGMDFQIGDSLVLSKDVASQYDSWTGTTLPYAIYGVKVRKLTVSEGKVTIILNYFK